MILFRAVFLFLSAFHRHKIKEMGQYLLAFNIDEGVIKILTQEFGRTLCDRPSLHRLKSGFPGVGVDYME